jgi:hypothetical protein
LATYCLLCLCSTCLDGAALRCHHHHHHHHHHPHIPIPALSTPQVKFDIDANGILSVTATDKGTGKKQDIKITGASVLPKVRVLYVVWCGVVAV